MQALYYDNDLRLREMPAPKRAGGEALVRMRYAGICHTDLEILRGYMDFKGIPGHEFVGEVIAAPGEEELVGKRVVGEINLPCGHCTLCSAGLARHCQERKVMGISGKDGVFAEYVTLPPANLHQVPDQVSDIAAVFTEPVAAALEIDEQIEISPRDRVAVLGDGKLGILAAQVIQRKAGDLISYGRAPEKAAFLKRLGIKAESGKSPRDSAFDIVVDCTGVTDGLKTALLAVKPRGTVVVKSTYSGGIELDFALPVIKEITIVGSRCGPFPRAIEALRDGKIEVEGMVSHTFPLSRGMEAMAAAADPQSLKVLIFNDLSFDPAGRTAD